MGEEYTYASVEEIEGALHSLSDEDYLRLKHSSTHLNRGNIFHDSDDLLQEAIERILDGRRKWPKEVKFTTFLYNTMKSIIHSWREKNQTAYILETDLNTKEENFSNTIGSNASSPEHFALEKEKQELAEKRLKEIYGHFVGDKQVTILLMGREDELKVKEIQDLGEMTSTEYETARKRLRRKLNKYYPNGLQL